MLSFTSWCQKQVLWGGRRRGAKKVARARRFRPQLEPLENRAMLAAYTAASVDELIAAIKSANSAGGINTIDLAVNIPSPTPYTYDLAAVNNTTNGANGLPVIDGRKENLTIIGHGDIIERVTDGMAPFRLFDVAPGASLTLKDVTLRNGLAQGSGNAAEGGAIYNEGTLMLAGVTIDNNLAQGSAGANGVVSKKLHKGERIDGQNGGDAAGGGIWSSGDVTLDAGTILQNNRATGGNGGNAGALVGVRNKPDTLGTVGTGGGGFGGGLYEAGGTVSVAGATLSGNTATGGDGARYSDAIPYYDFYYGYYHASAGGAGGGGGVYVLGGTLDVSNQAVVQFNWAVGGKGGNGDYSNYYYPSVGVGGHASGGGVAVAGGDATLDTVELSLNHAQGGIGGDSAITYGGQGGDAFGGGLAVVNGSAVLTNDTTSGNVAIGGNSGYNGEPSTPWLGYGVGGGVFNAGTIHVANSTFSGDESEDGYGYGYGGAGGGFTNAGSATISGGELSGNSAGQGGGFYNYGTLSINGNVLISGNHGDGGFNGGIYNNPIYGAVQGVLTIDACNFSGNDAFEGGALENNGTATVSGSQFSDNTANYGGAIFVDYYGKLTLNDCTLTNNSATYYGGAITNWYLGTLTISGCTITGNSAGGLGGGVYNYGTLDVANATVITGNTDSSGPEDLYNVATASISDDSTVGVIEP